MTKPSSNSECGSSNAVLVSADAIVVMVATARMACRLLHTNLSGIVGYLVDKADVRTN